MIACRLTGGLWVLLAGIGGARAEASTSAAEGPVIAIQASRFEYRPNRITLKKGQAVVLEIQATDRLHGFSIPELGVRADVTPGRKSTVRFMPAKTGIFTFYCDIFCGSGHEEMAGQIVVEN